jgi:hypothetical protein
MTTRILIMLCGLLLASCVSGRITSIKDPFYSGGPKQRFPFVM